MRAILFASATATTFDGRRLASRSCHADGAFPRASAERAPRFLAHLEDDRGCSVQTRNLRLMAIRAFARFVASRDPAQVGWCGHVRAIRAKKAMPQPIAWLTREQVDAMP